MRFFAASRRRPALVAAGASVCLFLVAGCENGGTPTVYGFGLNPYGRCNSVIVNIDLRAAHAVVDETRHDAPNCALSEQLQDPCVAEFRELGGGEAMRVTIDNCVQTIGTSPLFHCAFSRGEAGAIQAETVVACDCAGPECDESPPVCVSPDGYPGSCENCANGQDDDGNGLADCDDPNCEHSPDCAVQTTTTTSTTSSSVSLPYDDRYTVWLSMRDASNVGQTLWDIDYGANTPPRPTPPYAPECFQYDGLSSFRYERSRQIVHASTTGLDGAAGPNTVAYCRINADPAPTADDFAITVLETRDLGGNVIAPRQIFVAAIVPLRGPPDPSTSTSTTTSMSTTTTSSTLSTTTTTVPDVGEPYTVTFHLATSASRLGAIRFEVDYSGQPGTFQGHQRGADCTDQVRDSLLSASDHESTRDLMVGIISLVGFEAPADLVQCTFLNTAPDAPVAADFKVLVDEAVDQDLQTVDATVTVSVEPQAQ